MKIIFRVHAVERMFERGIGIKEIKNSILNGETIEEYHDINAYPASLINSKHGRRELHVVVAGKPNGEEVFVVTVYRPDRKKWVEGFRRRRDDLPDV